MNLKITKTLSVCLLALLTSADLVKAQSAWTIANGGGSATAENSRSICTDASGNIYITGSFQNTVDFNFGVAINSLTATGSLSDIFIASYEADGDYRWAVRAGSTDADNTGNGAICTDGTNVYVTGNFSGFALFGATGLTSAGGTDVFVAKLNATTGAWTWAKRYGGSSADNGYAVCLDASGNPYVAGNYSATWDGCVTPTSTGSTDLFVQKIDPATGNCTWVASGGSAAGGDAGTGAGICYVPGTDKIVVTTEYSGGSATYGALTALTNAGGNDIAILELNPSTGAFTSAVGFGTANNDDGAACAYDEGTGDVVITGAFDAADITLPGASGSITLTNSGGTDIWTGRYAMATHNFVWAKKAGGSSGTFNDERAFGICSDGDGTVAITGSYLSATSTFGSLSLTNASGMGQIFIAGYNATDGTELWVNKSVTTVTPALQSVGRSITTIGGSGTYWITGDFAATNTFGALTSLVSAGFDDIVNAKFTAPVICPGSPAISCGGPLTLNNDAGTCGAAVSNAQLLAQIVSSSGTPTPVITFSPAAGTFAVGTTQVTATATNTCGSATCTFDVTITDNEDPVITTGTIDACYQTLAAAEAAALAATTATDNCAGTPSEAASTAGTCTAVITVTVTDANSNTSTTTYTTRIDDTDPSVTPGTIDACYATVAAAEAAALAATSATDNCSGALIEAASTTGTCSAVVTVTTTDGCGNSTAITYNTRIDDTDPSVTPGSIDACYSSVAAAEAAALAATSATDNCSGALVEAASTTGTCSAVVTVTTTDGCGNSTAITYNTRIDDTDPIVTPGSIDACYPSVAAAEAAALAATSATDNCAGTLVETASTTGTCSAVVTVTTTDGCGNSTAVTYNTRIDDTDPSVTAGSIDACYPSVAAAEAAALAAASATDNCPGTLVETVSTTGTCSAVVTVTTTDGCGNSTAVTYNTRIDDTDPSVTPGSIDACYPTAADAETAAIAATSATDNCPGTLLKTASTTGTCSAVVTVTVTDGCGNSNAVTYNTRIDNSGPNVTPGTIAACYPTVAAAEAAALAAASATDNCNGTLVETVSTAGTCSAVITVTTTDGCGNATPVTYTTRIDNTAPTVTPGTIDACYLTVSAAEAAAISATSATDNCPGTLVKTASTTGTCSAVITVTVADGCGNSNSVTYNTRIDNTAPTVTPGTINSLYPTAAAAEAAALAATSATDNCPGTLVETASTAGTCSAVITVTTTDGCGNATPVTYNTVIDNTPPTAVCKNITVQLNPNGTASITGADVDDGSADACGIGSLSVSPSSFSCATIGSNTVTLTVTDVNGNSATCTASVTVEDNVDPVANCKNITVQLNSNGVATIAGADIDNGSTDVCGVLSLSASPNSFDCSDVGDNTVTLTVTDNNGNTATCTSTVTVEDNVDPVADCKNITVQLNANGTATIAGTDVDDGSSDACGIASLSVSPNTFDCEDTGDNTVTLTVTDSNGNTETCTATVTVEDNVDPVPDCKNITVQLDPNGTATITGADVDDGSTDACGIASLSVSPNTFDCSDIGGQNTVTLTVTDNNGNTATCTSTVTVEDNVDPVASCRNITVQLDANGAASIAGADVDDGSSDACGIASLTVSPDNFDCSDVGDNTVTLTVTDNNGNTETCTATVTVEDNVDPVADCKNITVQLNANGTATIAGADVDDGSADACGIGSLSVSPNTFDCEDIGDNTVTLTVTDNNGNTETCTATVTVEDNVDPVANCRNITVQLNSNGAVTITGADVDNGSSDACGIATLAVSPNTFDCGDVGDNTVTLTVTDNNGNTETCTATVTVEDNVDPVVICQNITIQLDANGAASITASQVNDGSSDACGIATLGVSPNTFDCGDVGDNTVTLTVTDNNGNSSTCTATVTVEDNVDPVATCKNITVQLNPNGIATIAGADVDDGSDDACGIASRSVSPNSFDCSDVGDNTVTLTVTDNNGNTATCTATVTVEDNVDPSASCQNITVQLDANGDATIVGADVDDGSSDACGIASLAVSPDNFDCNDVGDNTVTLTVTDNNGNSSTCTATVTIEDNVDPVATCQGLTIQLDANGNASILASQIDDGSSDACGIASLAVSPNTFDCSDVGDNTVTLTVTDNNGNSSTCTATVTVEDDIDPVASCQNITVQLNPNGIATITGADVDDGSDDACGIATLAVSPNSFDCNDIGANTVTLTVTDNNGNTETCTATVTVEDNVDPAANCQNITVQLDASGNASITAQDVDNNSSDACGIASITVSPNAFDCAAVGDNTVTLTVTDNNGNVSTCTSTVTVEDNVDPVAVCQNITIQLDANGTASIEAEDLDAGSDDACGGASVTASQTDFDCSDLGSNTITLTVTDVNGNSSTCTATVTVEDNIDPVVATPSDVNICVVGASGTTVEYYDILFTDNCGATVTQVAGLPSGSNFPVGVTTNTFEVEDASGNMVTVSFTVTIRSKAVPEFTFTGSCDGTAIQFTDATTLGVGTIDTWEWDFDDQTTSNDQNPSHLFADDGSYDVILTVTTDEGCVSSVTHEVSAYPTPTFTTQVSNVTCNGLSNGSIIIVVNNGSGPFYSSLNGGTEQLLNTFSGLAAGTYTVNVRTGNNCSAAQTVTITQPAALTVAADSVTPVNCDGDSYGEIFLAVTGGTQPYRYYVGGNLVDYSSGMISNLAGGEYVVTVKDTNNCEISLLVEVPVLTGLPTAGFTYDIDGLEITFTNTSVGGDNYHWSFGDGPSSTEENPVHTYPPNGNYNVTLITYNECGSDTMIVNLGILLGIENGDEGTYSFNVFPNPNNGSFTMMLESSNYMDELSIRIFTVEGKLIDDMNVAAGGKMYTRNFSYQLASGMYVLEVSDGAVVSHKRFVIR